MRVTFRCDPALIDRLEKPVLARTALPEWLRAMPKTAFSFLHDTDVRTVKQCPPFVDAMSHGFVMTLPCDVLVQNGSLSWDWDLPLLSVESHPRSPLSFHVPAQVSGTPFHREDRAIVKFNSFWTVELDDGYALFATHPANRDDLPFRLLTGMVDSDRFSQVGILFPAVWIDPGFEGVLKRGTPLAQCFPVERRPLTLVYEPFSEQHRTDYDATARQLLEIPGVYRKSFRAKRLRSPGEAASEGFEIEP